MGAIVNGLVLHGLRAYGTTFLIFLDYMKRGGPARGADGAPVDLGVHARLDRPRRGRPHAPADRAARRAAGQPNMNVRAPGRRERDGARVALRAPADRDAHRAGARARACRSMDPDSIPDDAIDRGAYVLRDAVERRARPDPDRTGSEVHICVGRRGAARGRDRHARVVSRPASTASRSRTRTTATSVLPPSAGRASRSRRRRRLAGAPGCGRRATAIGMTTFGASAPQPALYEHFGFTPEKVAERARAVVVERVPPHLKGRA